MSLLWDVLYAAHARSTHHKLALDALHHLQHPLRESWQDHFLSHYPRYLAGAKDPDDRFKDFRNHVLHVRENLWGGAIPTARKWYQQALEEFRRRNWSEAVYSAGVLSHYFTDPVQPFHTHQSQAETNIHRAFEWSTTKSYEQLRNLLDQRFGYPVVEVSEEEDWLEDLIERGARLSHKFYEPLIDHYDFYRGSRNPPEGLDEFCRVSLARLIGWAVVGYARVLDRLFTEVEVIPPPASLSLTAFFATLEIPIQWISAKITDVRERDQILRMYAEFQATGQVDQTLAPENRTIRDLVAARDGKPLTRAPAATTTPVSATSVKTQLSPGIETPPVKKSQEKQPQSKQSVANSIPQITTTQSESPLPVILKQQPAPVPIPTATLPVSPVTQTPLIVTPEIAPSLTEPITKTPITPQPVVPVIQLTPRPVQPLIPSPPEFDEEEVPPVNRVESSPVPAILKAETAECTSLVPLKFILPEIQQPSANGVKPIVPDLLFPAVSRPKVIETKQEPVPLVAAPPVMTSVEPVAEEHADQPLIKHPFIPPVASDPLEKIDFPHPDNSLEMSDEVERLDQTPAKEEPFVEEDEVTEQGPQQTHSGSTEEQPLRMQEERTTRSSRYYLEFDSQIVDAPSIGPKTAKRLKGCRIRTVQDLLQANPAELAAQLKTPHITEQLLRDWQDQARLVCGIPDLRGHDAQLLVACGVRSVVALAEFEPSPLTQRVERYCKSPAGQRILRNMAAPDDEEVSEWISNARQGRGLQAA